MVGTSHVERHDENVLLECSKQLLARRRRHLADEGEILSRSRQNQSWGVDGAGKVVAESSSQQKRGAENLVK